MNINVNHTKTIRDLANKIVQDVTAQVILSDSEKSAILWVSTLMNLTKVITAPVQSPISSLGIALRQEITRVRDNVLAPLVKLSGEFGVDLQAQIIRNELDAAAEALSNGDPIACLTQYERLKTH